MWDLHIYRSRPLGAPSEPENGHTYTPKNTIFPSIFVFVANIRYSTPKMTPLTKVGLQPISYLTGIGISTFPNHQGPHQCPKIATQTPWKILFSLASLFLWLISGTLPQKCFPNGHMYTPKNTISSHSLHHLLLKLPHLHLAENICFNTSHVD